MGEGKENIMEKEYNENDMDWNALEGDFYGFLEEKNWDAANVIIDNLAELKEFEKGLEFCMKRCAAIMKDRMILSANYGETVVSNGTGGQPAGSVYLPGKGIVPADYGEEKIEFRGETFVLPREGGGYGVVENQMDVITKGLIF